MILHNRTKSKAHSIVGDSNDRAKHDFYPTPPYAVEALLKREKFEGTIWECASGDGRMAKTIEKYYPGKVRSSDIQEEDWVYGEKGVDFLQYGYYEADNIITNPPYKYATEFVKKALFFTEKKVAMFLKLAFLEGIKRYDLFKNSPLKKVYVFSKRVTLTKDGIKMKNSGMIAYAWFVWDKSYEGEPTIDWIYEGE